MLKLNFATKFAYGCGEIPRGIKDTLFQTFLFFYFSQVLGLPASLAGLAALIALLIDSITDPLMGDISDNWHSKWGRRHPFMMFSVIPFVLSIYMLFTPPETLDHQGLFFWMLLWSIFVRVMLTFYNVPHNAMGAELTKDYELRTSIVSFRVFMGYLGGITLSVIALNSFFAPTEVHQNGMLNASGYSSLGILAACLSGFAMIYCIVGTKHTIQHLPQADSGSIRVSFGRTFRAFKEALSLKPFRIIIAVAIFMAIALGAANTFILYLGNYFFEFTPSEIALLTLSLVVGLVPASIIAPAMCKRFDKMPTLVACLILGTLFAQSSIIFRLLGWFPENGSELLLPITFITYVGGYSFFIATAIVIGSMLADITDLHETKTNKRQEGIFFSANSFAQKATFGIGTMFAGIGLEVIDFPRQANVADVSSDMLVNLGLISGPLLLVIYLFTAWIASKYDLDKQAHQKIVESLAKAK